jgi:hypothetical protein
VAPQLCGRWWGADVVTSATILNGNEGLIDMRKLWDESLAQWLIESGTQARYEKELYEAIVAAISNRNSGT